MWQRETIIVPVIDWSDAQSNNNNFYFTSERKTHLFICERIELNTFLCVIEYDW